MMAITVLPMFFLVPSVLVIAGLIVVGLIIATAVLAGRNQAARQIIITSLIVLGFVMVAPTIVLFGLRLFGGVTRGMVGIGSWALILLFVVGLAVGLGLLLFKGPRAGRVAGVVTVIVLAILIVPVAALFQGRTVRAPVEQTRSVEVHSSDGRSVSVHVGPSHASPTPLTVSQPPPPEAGLSPAAPHKPRWPEVAGLADRYPTTDSAIEAAAEWVSEQLTEISTTGPPAEQPIHINVAGSATDRLHKALIDAINRTGPRFHAASPGHGPPTETLADPNAPAPAQLVMDLATAEQAGSNKARIITLKLTRPGFEASTALMAFDMPWVLDPSGPFADGHVVGYSRTISPDRQMVETEAQHAAVAHLIEYRRYGGGSGHRASSVGNDASPPASQEAEALTDRIMQADDWPVTVFTQTFDRPYGQVYRSAVLIEPTPQNMHTLADWVHPPGTAAEALSRSHRVKDLFSGSIFGRAAQGAVLVGVLVVVYAVFNAVTQPRDARRRHGPKAGMLLLAVVLTIGVAGLLLIFA